MKKTEKIEIRVSVEEKQRLINVARSENRTLSELIRNILATYAQSKADNGSPTKTRIGRVAKSPKTWSIATVLTFLLAAITLATPAQAENVYALNLEIRNTTVETSTLSTERLETHIVCEKDECSSFFEIPSNDGGFQVGVRFLELEDDTTFAEFKICKKTEDECELVAEPSLLFAPPSAAHVKITDTLVDEETGAETPYELITIDIVQDNP